MPLKMDPQLKFVHHTVKMLRRITLKTAILWCYLTTIAPAVNGQRRNIGGEDLPASRMNYNPKEEILARENKSKEVQKYMNLSVDPCSDFYEFTCGMWNEVHKQEDDQVISQEYLLESNIIENLQKLLEKPPPGQVSLSGQKIKNFYDSCLQERAQSQQNNFYMDFIRKHGGLPDVIGTNWNQRYNWEVVLGDLRLNYGMEILMGLKIEPSMENTRGGGNSVFLDEPTLTLLPEELCSAEALTNADSLEESYNDIEEVIAKNLGNWFKLREAETKRIAGDIVRFEFQLCKQIRKDQLIEDEEQEENELPPTSRGKVRNRMGQSRIHNNHRKQSPYLYLNLQQLTNRFEQHINFVRYLSAVFPPQFSDQVYLRSEAYFSNLARLLKDTKKPTLAYYIMYNAVSAISFPKDDHPNDRPNFCTKLAMRYFPQHLGEMYYSKYYLKEIKEDTEIIYQKIDEAFNESFDVPWMADKFKHAAQQKLGRFKVKFPAYENLDLQDLHFDNVQYWQKLERIMKYKAKQELSKLSTYANRQSERVVEAYDIDFRLETRENELQVGLGLLQPPFYHHHFYGNSLKYSLLGQALAKTLVSAFDEQGWNKDQQSPMHWDEYTTQGFHNISQCFREQNSHYLYNNPDEFRNAFKLREFIADSSGLNIAFRAYLLWLNTMGIRDRSLPKETLSDLNFTNTQLFFINFAQTRCATTGNGEQKNIFPIDWHTEERFSVNGPLSNFNEFAREFNCAPGSEMNPDDKCVLF